ncbi:N-acetylmuramoyl-L-alanine amidase [Longimicrobium sp.]|uniref:N-acetylmuramoyl-L-alanine amidase n=1 Tax=Longimicrobium sp. TaxID=2029185 RepID=UPI002E3186A4|nr:N-acetylmuramoyl-L-alanine amidase [Longimicrobium sp.]HEX6040254.1 N-acetylmuramoyl-L-alanine amidase [Longimicrobium sp.]
MKIVNHRLVKDDGTPYPFRDTPNRGLKGNKNAPVKHRWLVMHYTAGGSASESIDWLANPEAGASAHIVIGKDGRITQMVPFNIRSWHAGESEWKGVKFLNGHSIGIELDGFGFLGNAGPGKWKFKGQSIPDSEVVVATHKFGKPKGGWPRYPQKQLDVALELAALLVKTYGLEDVIGHDDISPGRKQDPGPAFDMAGFRAAAMAGGAAPVVTPTPPPADGTAPATARFRVKTTLNVRSGPGASNPTVAGSPLAAGTFVRAGREQDGWRQVTTEGGVSGWASAQFLEPAPAALFTVSTSLNIRGGPSAGDAPVPGSPLPAGTIVEGLQDQGDWKRVAVQGAANGRSGIVGWVAARFLQPSVIPVSGIGQPAET